MRNPCAGITRFRFYGSNLSPPISEHPLASSLLTGGKGIKKVWNRQNILRKNPAATIWISSSCRPRPKAPSVGEGV